MSLLRKASIVTTPTSYENGKILSVKPVQSFGSELVSQPNFQSQGSWFVFNNNQGTIGGGTATIIGDGSNAFAQWRHNFSVSTSKKYELIVTISETNNNIEIAAASGVTDFPTKGNAQTGTHTFRFTPTATTFVLKIGINNNPNGNATLTFVSLKEVIDADFDFTRNSSATRTNSQGLIEDITANLPRIDYTGGVGHWLFEPQSTNLWRNSEGSDITLTSPLGTFGFYNITSSQISNPEAFTAGTIVSATFIVKKADGTEPTVTASGLPGDVIFRITGTSSAGEAGTLTDIGNGFYTYKLENYSVSGNNSDNRISNNSGDVVYVSLVQLEQQSYATSYIPTSGEVNGVTRLADAASGAGSSDLINSTEGVLYAEIAALADDNTFRLISLLDPVDNTNRLDIGFSNTNGIYANVRTSGNSKISSSTVDYNIGQYYKIAIKWSNTEGCSFYLDGVEIQTGGNTSFTTSDFTSLQLKNAFNNPLYGKTKCVAVFKEALTDAELTCLTTI